MYCALCIILLTHTVWIDPQVQTLSLCLVPGNLIYNGENTAYLWGEL